MHVFRCRLRIDLMTECCSIHQQPYVDSRNQWFHTELPEVPHTSFVITARYVNEQKVHVSVRRLLASVVGVNLFGVFRWLWTSPFQSSIVSRQRSPIQVCSWSLSLIIHLSVPFVPLSHSCFACMIFLFNGFRFFSLSCLHFSLTFSLNSLLSGHLLTFPC